MTLLLNRGTDINAVGSEYGTALTAAALGGRKDIVSLLLDKGANIGAVGGGNMDTVSLLLEHGADVIFVSGNSATAPGVYSFCFYLCMQPTP